MSSTGSASRASVLSTADARRPLVAAAAMRGFARGGYHGTTVADVAREAKISPAYVFKLYSGKEALFIAALEACFDAILVALEEGADAATDQKPETVLDAMGDAYAHLISDRTLLMLQVHAQSVADIPEIGAALRAGLGRITTYVQSRSGGSDDDVQRFIAYGQLCHLIVTTQLDGRPEEWVPVLTKGITHPD
ncbi:TetR/AcrR family transcriptional regulator [Microbacterium paraoxydans]|uniref:TetR/AcrR family transcriptional regulator n=1 Tax=Microbacterium paraoxydans TaxID=199592 RepID=A0ABS5IIW9_9MICO|nr:TetR/AcrR family transcriptional regulator [Microbacterium paraoxydans]MBS0022765.1 TetR/AcrR family transcriptional regulator [Microbacterium paraoxydans]